MALLHIKLGEHLCLYSCPIVFKKNDENKWPESEDIDASSSLSWFQFTYTVFSGLTREQGQMGSNVPFSTKILWF